MTVPITHPVFNEDGTPKLDATPVFLLGPDGARDYRSRLGPRTPPAIARIRENVYGFTPKESDARIGTVYVMDAGPGCFQRYFVGVIHQTGRPFDAAFFTDLDGVPWTGPAPTVGLYSDVAGNLRMPPQLQLMSGAYLYTISPTTADLNARVTFRIDAPSGALPASWHGNLFTELDALSVTKAAVLERFPELDGEPALSELVWNELLLDVAMEIPVKSWLDQDAADRAALWLAAHMVALEKRRTQGGIAGALTPGQLQSITVGPVTKTWAVPKETTEKSDTYATDEILGQTEYGREYMRLRRRFCRAVARH